MAYTVRHVAAMSGVSVRTLHFYDEPGLLEPAHAGALVYRLGSRLNTTHSRRLTVTDSTGRTQRSIPGRIPWVPRFSPEGRRVAYGAYAPGHDSADVWVADLATGATQRLTTDGEDNNEPVWSPDGRWIAYGKIAAGGRDVYARPLDGGPARLLVRRPGIQLPTDWLRDGSGVLFTDVAPAGDMDLWVQPPDGGPARPYVVTPAHEVGARISPDGRWAAYQSDETGRNEVYLQSFPTPGRRTLVSSAGGVHPVWRGDGRAIYYWQMDQLMVAHVDATEAGGLPVVRGRTPLFRAPYIENFLPMYDVSPDGARFAVVTGEPHTGRLVVALTGLGTGRTPSRSGR